MRADAGNYQKHDVKHGNGQRDAQNPPRPMGMPVSAMRVHIPRIAQADRVERTRLARHYASAAFARIAARTVARVPPPAICSSNTQEEKVKKLLVAPALLFAVYAIAQTAPAPTKNPVSSALRDILPGRQKNTIAAVDAMPADKFNFKPSPDQMTFGHLVAHMIEANYLLCSKSAGVAAPKVEEAKDSDAKDKLVTALKASFDFCSETLAKMDDSKLSETTEGLGGQQFSHARFALGLASNWADHYAEASMYLRQNGILPPTAKK